jgi:hypothetical protein
MICMSADCGRWRVRSSGVTSNSDKQCYFYHFNRTAMIAQCYSILLPFKHIIEYCIRLVLKVYDVLQTPRSFLYRNIVSLILLWLLHINAKNITLIIRIISAFNRNSVLVCLDWIPILNEHFLIILLNLKRTFFYTEIFFFKTF